MDSVNPGDTVIEYCQSPKSISLSVASNTSLDDRCEYPCEAAHPDHNGDLSGRAFSD